MARSTGRDIATKLTLSGEQEFKQALSDAAREVRVMDADLKAITAEFKATGDAQTYITQKTDMLKSKMEEQQRIIDMLNDRLRENKESNKLSAAQVDDYKIRLSNATAKMFNMRRELENVDREAEEFGRDSVKVGRQIENGIGDGAEEAQGKVKALVEQMQEDIGSIKGSMAFTMTSQIINVVSGAIGGISDFVTSNQEYRRKIANFETAARMGNHNVDEMRRIAADLGAFLGDQDAALNAVTSLMNTGLTQSGIEKAVDILKSLSLILGEEGKIEDLAESLQQSVSTGEVTGRFAESGERLKNYGITKGGLQAVMDQAGQSPEAKGLAALTYLSKAYNKKIIDQYNEETKSLQEAAAAQIELNQAWADLSEALEPFSTWIVQRTTDGVNAIKASMDLAMGKVQEAAKEMGLDTSKMETEDVMQAMYGQEAPIQIGGEGKTFWDYIKDAFTKKPDETDAGKAGQDSADAYAAGLEEGRASVQDVIKSYWEAGGASAGEEAAKSMIEKMKPTAEEIAEMQDYFSAVGADITVIFDNLQDDAATSGNNAASAFRGNLTAVLSETEADVRASVSRMNAALASVGAGLGNIIVSGGGSYYNGGSTGRQSIISLRSNLYMDKKLVATTVDRYQGRMATRLG